MNNWQLSFQSPVDLTNHLNKPYLLYDNKEKNVNKIVFDEDINLIWAGDTYGRISSYDPSYSLYTRHTAHIGAMPVVDIVSHRQGILSLSSDSLNFCNRRGVTKLNLTSADIAQLSDMKSLCYSKTLATHVYCGGSNLNSGILDIDLTKGCISSNFDYPSKIKLLSSNNKYIVIGKQQGTIDLFDQTSNQIIKSFSGHSSTLTSMDFRDYTLVTAGKSKKFSVGYSDPFVNIYDLRIMKQLPPISFSKASSFTDSSNLSLGADFVQLHPILPTVIAVASCSGSFDFIDLANPTLRTQYCHPCQSIKQFKLSPNGDYIAVIEQDNNINMWSRSNGLTGFTNSNGLLELPDFVDDHPKNISIDDFDYPLSSIGLPYYKEKLLSAWPQQVFRSDGTIPRKIDLATMPSPVSSIRPNSSRSNLHLYSTRYPLQPYNRLKYGHRNVSQPYRSLRERKKKFLTTDEDEKDKEELMNHKPINDTEIPPAFSKLQMSYGKYGVRDFDFSAFNKTQYSGLEVDVDNVYTNAILQMCRFVPEVYNFLVCCLKDENFSDSSLLTELGTLYDMMGRANGVVCRSSNFQEILNSLDDAKELGIVGDQSIMTPNSSLLISTPSTPVTSRNLVASKFDTLTIDDPQSRAESQDITISQKFTNFLLSRLISEELQKKINSTQSIVLEELLGIDLETVMRSLSTCGSYYRESHIVPTLNITSPVTNNIKYSNKKMANQTILPYIESSMNRMMQTKIMCDKCHKYETVDCEKIVRNLPPLLSLNIQLTPNEWSIAKTVKCWLSKDFFATISKGRPILKMQPTDLKTNNAIFKYELNTYVARISDDFSESHLVTYAKIFDQNTKSHKWYMFNDYLVREVSEEEALDISYWWKTPEILIYSDAEEMMKPFVSVSSYTINDNILYRDYFSNALRQSVKKEYELLSHQEAPCLGALVALDAEFVIINDEQIEISCKNIKSLIKPTKTALARVSVLRGDGEKVGVPFIDDYVENTMPIENYLTKYSGIEPGDLDPNTSTKNLVPRTVVYRKLWLLLQLGCIFVGHGLFTDFRNINIYVPQEQICDTALYYLQGRRYLSLRYLAYALLDHDIQSGNHDSIEDAYTALILYRKYLDLKEKGIFEEVLNKIYDEGRSSNYKVPENWN